MGGGVFYCSYNPMPFTAVSVILSEPGTYTPVNCADEAVVLAVAINGVSAAITLAVFELTTNIFAPCIAVISYNDFPPPETVPLIVAVLVAPATDGAT